MIPQNFELTFAFLIDFLFLIIASIFLQKLLNFLIELN